MILKYSAPDLNNSLFVAAKIIDVVTGALVSTIAMIASGINGAYYLSYEAPAGKTYLANMMAYTDGSFTTPNTAYVPADQQVSGPDDGACVQAFSVIGIVNNPSNVAGFVNCDCD